MGPTLSDIRSTIDILQEAAVRSGAEMAVTQLRNEGHALGEVISLTAIEKLLTEHGVDVRRIIRHRVFELLREHTHAQDLFEICREPILGIDNPLIAPIAKLLHRLPALGSEETMGM